MAFEYEQNLIKGATPRFPKVNEQSVRLLVQSGVKYGRGAGIQAIKPKLFFIDPNEPDQPDAFSYLGTEVFSNLIINGGSYFDENGVEITYPAFGCDTVLFNVTQTKNIVKTAIQGRNGTIKEYISDGDFEIEVRGVIVSKNPLHYPDDEVASLVEVLKVPTELRITSSFLNNLGIDDVVIENYSFQQNEGFYNSQLFTIKMVSETPIELRI